MSEERKPFVMGRLLIDLTIIFAFLAQFGSTVWFAAKLDSRVAALEAWLLRNETSIQSVDVMTERLANMQASLNRLERLLEAHAEGKALNK